jgi:hypothetical protein
MSAFAKLLASVGMVFLCPKDGETEFEFDLAKLELELNFLKF